EKLGAAGAVRAPYLLGPVVDGREEPEPAAGDSQVVRRRRLRGARKGPEYLGAGFRAVALPQRRAAVGGRGDEERRAAEIPEGVRRGIGGGRVQGRHQPPGGVR